MLSVQIGDAHQVFMIHVLHHSLYCAQVSLFDRNEFRAPGSHINTFYGVNVKVRAQVSIVRVIAIIQHNIRNVLLPVVQDLFHVVDQGKQHVNCRDSNAIAKNHKVLMELDLGVEVKAKLACPRHQRQVIEVVVDLFLDAIAEYGWDVNDIVRKLVAVLDRKFDEWAHIVRGHAQQLEHRFWRRLDLNLRKIG